MKETVWAHARGCSRSDVRESHYVPGRYVYCASCERLVRHEKNKSPVRSISATPDKTEEKTDEEPRPVPPKPVRTEALVCAACGDTWDRPIKRGRKPSRCPACS